MKSKFFLGAAFSLFLMGAISPTVKANETPTAEENAFMQKGCFRQNFSGIYETKTDLGLNRIGWTLIHSGACTQCEGKTVAPPDSCVEPGDREHETKPVDPSDSQMTELRPADTQDFFKFPSW